MNVSTRLVLGFGLVLALFAALTIYNVSAMYDLAGTNRQIARTARALQLASSELPIRLDGLEEFARKYAITGDSAYAERFDEHAAALGADLETLAAAADGGEAAARVQRLREVWRGYDPRLRQRVTVGREDTTMAVRGSEGAAAWPAGLEGPLVSWIRMLRDETASTARALRDEMNQGATAAVAEARWAEQISWLVAGGALLVAILVAGAVAGSIYRQLVRLAEGTRRVARGDFHVRLESGRDDEFRQLVDDFNAMADRLAEFDEMKRAFLSRISHDLKSPLASMQEALAVLADGIGGELNPKQRRLVEMSQANGQRLSRMISKVLALARMEEDVGAVSRDPGDLRELVRETAEEFETRLAERPVELQVVVPDEPVPAEFDEQLMRQLLDNLLENALRYTPEDGIVRLRLERPGKAALEAVPDDAARAVHAPEGDLLLLEVADSGPGVPDGEKARVFDRFERGDHPDGAGGVGLGLTICREVARAHGGEIWVDDGPDGGAAFRVLLPARLSGEETPERRKPVGAESSPAAAAP